MYWEEVTCSWLRLAGFFFASVTRHDVRSHIIRRKLHHHSPHQSDIIRTNRGSVGSVKVEVKDCEDGVCALTCLRRQD